MSGLEKIKNQIMEEAQEEAKKKEEEARIRAKEIIEKAKIEADQIEEEMRTQGEEAEKKYHEQTLSALDVQRRTKILRAKQDMISSVIEKAYETLDTMEEQTYFKITLRLIEKYAMEGSGKVILGKKDLARLPEGFRERIAEIAKAKGGELEISDEDRNIEYGFILQYGGVEENCTLRTLFETKKEEQSYEIHRLLFS